MKKNNRRKFFQTFSTGVAGSLALHDFETHIAYLRHDLVGLFALFITLSMFSPSGTWGQISITPLIYLSPSRRFGEILAIKNNIFYYVVNAT